MCRSQVAVTRSRMVFAETVGFVESALAPCNVELPLLHPVTCRAKARVHSFGLLLFDGVAGCVGGCVVVSLNRSWGLQMSHFLECGAD
jgi:hypothetical protein